MSECTESLLKLSLDFRDCRKSFIAIGDETRQQIIITLLESDYNGIRVGEITKKTHLSRASVAHHLKILKDAGIVTMRREGTRNYYFMNANNNQWQKIMNFIENVNKIIQSMPHEEKPIFNGTDINTNL